MVNETVNVLREQVAQLTKERDEARDIARKVPGLEFDLKAKANECEIADAEVTRLTAERDEWRALATRAQDQRDQWMSKAGELTEQVAELRAHLSGTSDTNPRI